MKKLLILLLLITISLSLSGCKEKLDGNNCSTEETYIDGACENTREYFNNTTCQFDEETNLLACAKTWSQYLHTTVALTVYFDADEALDSKELFSDVEDIISYYNKTSDKYTSYVGVTNIKTINDNPTAIHTVDEKLFELIDFTLSHQGEVNNLFNAALGPVLQIWHNYREDCNVENICNVPTFEELNAKKPLTNPLDVTLDHDNFTVTMKEGMSLDLGGVSKGFISGEIIEYLDSLNLYGFLLNNGNSNISVGGLRPKRASGEFLIGVLDPRNSEWESDSYATVYLADNEQLVTSGDYQQYFVANGEFYHHIIHNETLFPERYSRSVSIVTNDPALADLYSTAIFCMTIEDGKEFVNGIEGLEAMWFDLDNKIHFSTNFESEHLGELLIEQ